jgi:hypothetical protein
MFTRRDLRARARNRLPFLNDAVRCNSAATTPSYFVKARKEEKKKRITAALLRDGVRARL